MLMANIVPRRATNGTVTPVHRRAHPCTYPHIVMAKEALMTPVRLAFLDAASSAAALLADPKVAAGWNGPSALRGFSVGGLSVHLASQVLNAEGALDREIPDLEQVTLLEHYARSPWFAADVEDEPNQSILAGGESGAAAGPVPLNTNVIRALSRLRAELAWQAPHRLGFMPWWRWTLSFDDLLVTRMMEIAVHSDDLAVSVGVPTPPLPPAVMEPVLALLAELSLRRHGPTALLRAYSRTERAPTSISAF
jgi:Mycothiol maleylpyruvate isomerase N-terminal domain